MSAPASRPTFSCDFAHVLGSPPTSLSENPIVPAAAPADLAQSCDWAVGHSVWINATARAWCDTEKFWTEDKLSDELCRYNAVVDRALDEPSGDLGAIQAKARLCLFEMEDAGEFEEANPGV